MRDGSVYTKWNEQDARLDRAYKVLDKLYFDSLTSRMMWDCLMGLLEKKGIILAGEFDVALKALSEATQKAMLEAEAKKKRETEGKVTTLSEKPAIPVVK